jgi:hypothetical protein
MQAHGDMTVSEFAQMFQRNNWKAGFSADQRHGQVVMAWAPIR